MAASRKRSREHRIAANPPGLLVNKPDDFLKQVRTALTNTLGLPFAQLVRISQGAKQTNYVCASGAEKVMIGGKPHVALRIITAETSIWMVVEMEWEGSKPALMQHVSLKVHEGQTSETAKLCFRAEWDFRDQASEHAQPHWNVHAPDTPYDGATDLNFEEFAKADSTDTFDAFVLNEGDGQEAAGDTLEAGGQGEEPGYTSGKLHQFHFAMSADWRGAPGTHSPKIDDPEHLVQWIAQCAQYIRGQMAFMRRA
jgi:hypothetical protein